MIYKKVSFDLPFLLICLLDWLVVFLPFFICSFSAKGIFKIVFIVISIISSLIFVFGICLHVKKLTFDSDGFTVSGLFGKRDYSWSNLGVNYYGIDGVFELRPFTLEIITTDLKKYYCFCNKNFYEKISRINW